MLRLLVLARRPHGPLQNALWSACDTAAFETALALALGRPSRIAVLCTGPVEHDVLLADALGRGADRALRISFGNLDEIDPVGVATLLAAGAKHVGFDLILTGDRSQDGAQGFMGPAVAELLKLPHLGRVRRAMLQDGELQAETIEGSSIRTYDVPMPALLCVSTPPQTVPVDRPRGTTPLELLSPNAIGLGPHELRNREPWGRLLTARAKRSATPTRDAGELIVKLRAEGLIESPPW